MQWKKEMYTITIAMLALLFYHFDLPSESPAMYNSQSVVENENRALTPNP
jgi:hypothetical protein